MRAHAAANLDEAPRFQVAQEIVKHLRISAPITGVVVIISAVRRRLHGQGEQLVVEIERIQLREHFFVIPLDAW